MKSFIPARKHFSFSPLSALAVSAMIGTVSPSALISFVAANPSITGMWQSIKIRSYGFFRAIALVTLARPNAPLLASSTDTPISFNCSLMTIWFISLSSTTNTRDSDSTLLQSGVTLFAAIAFSFNTPAFAQSRVMVTMNRAPSPIALDTSTLP